VLIVGFGITFYGFFVFAGLWVTGYSIWAKWINASERRRESSAVTASGKAEIRKEFGNG
jgi:hypothetical protein